MPAQGEATSSTSKATATRPTATPRRGARGAPKETKEPEAEEAGNGESEETAAVEPAVKKTKEAPAPAAEDNGDKAEAEKSEEAQVAEKEPEAEKEKPKKNGEEPAEPASEAAEPMETEPPQIERHMEEQSAADVVAPTEVKTEEPDHEGGGDADTSDNRYPDHYFVAETTTQVTETIIENGEEKTRTVSEKAYYVTDPANATNKLQYLDHEDGDADKEEKQAQVVKMLNDESFKTWQDQQPAGEGEASTSSEVSEEHSQAYTYFQRTTVTSFIGRDGERKTFLDF
ncbi:hypothetical protein L596_023951 [Steinernema carpocapsae]|uniref:Uncharacterized protein n=1 Tax=Steinernema carpocapsae TaxID=34508 RepID=A0A4U5MF72_STECR|nr:hypothetical protein L596_023951 [Steinernema carpocapsae]